MFLSTERPAQSHRRIYLILGSSILSFFATFEDFKSSSSSLGVNLSSLTKIPQSSLQVKYRLFLNVPSHVPDPGCF